MRRIPLAMVLALLCVAQAAAIGLSPPNARLDYEPGKTYEFSVQVMNLHDFPIGLESRTTGSLGEPGVTTVKLPTSIPAHGSASVPVTIVLPTTRERPGHQISYIFFAEKYVDKTQGTFAVRTEAGVTVDVWQPYPGKYAEITVSAPSVSKGEDTTLQVYVNNLGVEPIVDGSATVRVVSADGVTKDTFSFAPINVEGNSNAGFKDVILSSGYEPGKYVLDARLSYGGNSSRMNSSFIVGKQDVYATGVQGSFYLDQPVNKFEIPIESLWNLPLDNVYAEFELGSGATRTSSVTLSPFQQTTLGGYWETDHSLTPGQHDASVKLYFPGGEKSYTFPITVYNETPKPVLPEEEEPSLVLSGADIIFAVLAIIIVVCIIVFAVQRHKRSPEPPVPPPPSP